MSSGIERRRKFTKEAPSKDASKLYILSEGSVTECNYFNFFKELSSNLDVIVIPSEGGKTGPDKLYEFAEKIFFGDSPCYKFDPDSKDMVWFVTDVDQWVKQGKDVLLCNRCDFLNDKFGYKAFNISQSNPCFEIWLYYHFYVDKPIKKEVSKFTSFKDFVNGKISGGFKVVDAVKIEDAIKNSKRNYGCDVNGNLLLFSTDLFELGDRIFSFVKAKLMVLKRKF